MKIISIRRRDVVLEKDNEYIMERKTSMSCEVKERREEKKRKASCRLKWQGKEQEGDKY